MSARFAFDRLATFLLQLVHDLANRSIQLQVQVFLPKAPNFQFLSFLVSNHARLQLTEVLKLAAKVELCDSQQRYLLNHLHFQLIDLLSSRLSNMDSLLELNDVFLDVLNGEGGVRFRPLMTVESTDAT